MADDTALVDSFLSDLSPKDKPWDKHKFESVQIRKFYEKELEFRKYAERMGTCSGYLDFALKTNAKTGEVSYKLRKAHFCRVRHCPMCQWRRCLLWRAKLYKALPLIKNEYPKARFLYLVFTINNCEITDLRETIQGMNKAWGRFVKRKEFADYVLGWIRTTEVTRSKKDGSAHPHFNLLLMVKPGYFAQGYMNKHEWAALWRDCAKLDYDPQVWVSILKDKKKKPKAGEDTTPSNAVMEALKYSVKPEHMLQNAQWFYELNRQVKNLRFIAAGGVFKHFLKDENEITETEMLLLGEDGEEVEPDEETENIVSFLWNGEKRRYAKAFEYQMEKPTVSEAADEAAWAAKLKSLVAGSKLKVDESKKPKPGPGSGFCSGAAVD